MSSGSPKIIDVWDVLCAKINWRALTLDASTDPEN